MSIKSKLIKVWFILFIISMLLTPVALGAGYIGFFPEQETYHYDVKAQQVFDAERVEDGDVTQFEELEHDERELLYEAFKKTDHFMGSSEVTITKTEQLETFNDWRTIESNGVLLLVAINEETRTQADLSEYVWYHWILSLAPIYFAFSFFAMLLAPPSQSI